MLQREPYRSERDSQRQKLYDAETAASFALWDRKNPPLPTVEDIAVYVQGLLLNRRVRAAFPFVASWSMKFIKVKDGRGRTSACAGASEMSFPVGSRNPEMVIHEFAHLVHHYEKFSLSSEFRPRKGYFAAHGWRFAMIELELVRIVFGKARYDQLKAAFKKGRVRHRPPRVLSPEQRLALANRLRRLRGEPIQLAA